MAVGPASCQGHQVRQDTAAKIKKEKLTQPKVIDSNMKIYIKKGGKNGSEIKLKDLNDIVRATEEWREVERGNGMVVPSIELRMKTIPRPDNSGKRGFEKNFQKKKLLLVKL